MIVYIVGTTHLCNTFDYTQPLPLTGVTVQPSMVYFGAVAASSLFDFDEEEQQE